MVLHVRPPPPLRPPLLLLLLGVRLVAGCLLPRALLLLRQREGAHRVRLRQPRARRCRHHCRRCAAAGQQLKLLRLLWQVRRRQAEVHLPEALFRHLPGAQDVAQVVEGGDGLDEQHRVGLLPGPQLHHAGHGVGAHAARHHQLLLREVTEGDVGEALDVVDELLGEAVARQLLRRAAAPRAAGPRQRLLHAALHAGQVQLLEVALKLLQPLGRILRLLLGCCLRLLRQHPGLRGRFVGVLAGLRRGFGGLLLGGGVC
mmetsp:Transcript_833/g.2034  ORF Transcript_833/g.2034 Transcript_833/m.2034 type:complete len:258 (+) Transcript_833:85-858(+)